MYADLVFVDEEYYPAVDGNDDLEVDDYLMVRPEYKSRVLNLLGQAFYGISDTCGETVDVRLLYMLDRMARSGHWKSMDEIETWLMDRDVPFTKQRRVEIKK
jgi:hypothetical protein